MIHYTLNTGDSRESPRSEVGEGVTEALAYMLASGEHKMPGMTGYTCRVTIEGDALIATVFCGNRPCVTFGVAPDDAAADSLWPHLEKQYLSITEMPAIRGADFAASHRPPSTPWCAAMTILAAPDEAMWIADFERCLAWAWL